MKVGDWVFCIEISPNDEQSYEAMRKRDKE